MMEANPFFRPWIGKNYSSTGFRKKRVLVLGESHYCGIGCSNCGDSMFHSQCNDFTKTVITRLISYYEQQGPHEDWMRTFTKFVNLVYGSVQDKNTLINFWNSVAFYNYVQVATDGPRISPSHDHFRLSEQVFFQTLKNYNPDLIIVWGKRLWGLMPDENYTSENNNLEYYIIDNWKYRFISINHPSAKPNYENYETIRYFFL